MAQDGPRWGAPAAAYRRHIARLWGGFEEKALTRPPLPHEMAILMLKICSWRPLGRLLGALLGPLGDLLRPLGALLEPLGRLLEASWGFRGRCLEQG